MGDYEIIEVSPEDRWEKWYLAALSALKSLNRGDGGISVMMIAFPLYERFLEKEERLTKEPRFKIIKRDLKFNSKGETKQFWNVFRDGLCHSATFFTYSESKEGKRRKLPPVYLAGTNEGPKYLDRKPGKSGTIIFDPWWFVDRVKQKYIDDPHLFDREDAPLLPLFYKVEKRNPEG